ncbi:hypothetical protein C5167_041611 [Papaver somniferum]|nr:hypothetical protein C5167_041611 [Papaver somniferum]
MFTAPATVYSCGIFFSFSTMVNKPASDTKGFPGGKKIVVRVPQTYSFVSMGQKDKGLRKRKSSHDKRGDEGNGARAKHKVKKSCRSAKVDTNFQFPATGVLFPYDVLFPQSSVVPSTICSSPIVFSTNIASTVDHGKISCLLSRTIRK